MVSKSCANILMLLHCQLLHAVLGKQHVGCEMLQRDGILESFVDNFLIGTECTFRQEAQLGCGGALP